MPACRCAWQLGKGLPMAASSVVQPAAAARLGAVSGRPRALARATSPAVATSGGRTEAASAVSAGAGRLARRPVGLGTPTPWSGIAPGSSTWWAWPAQSNHRGRAVAVICAASAKKAGKEVYVCTDCGEEHPMWQGKCRACKAWNTLVSFRPSPVTPKGGTGGGGAAVQAVAALDRLRTADRAEGNTANFKRKADGAWVGDSTAGLQKLSDVTSRGSSSQWRLQLPGDNGHELGRVLGGGVVPGSMVLMTGDPGVGKSTLLLQMAALLADHATGNSSGQDVMYVSAEESAEQVADRARRMGLQDANILLLNATRLDSILETVVRSRPSALIVDSIQTVYLEGGSGSVGSVSQVRECATAILQVAKRENIPVFIVGHVTKTGEVAGPRVLEHIVDVVLYLEGERNSSYRMLRSTKNRYGPTDEVGVFSMGDAGFAAVSNPSAEFMSSRAVRQGVGSSVAATLEGTRPMLLEVQALCTPVFGEEASGNLIAIGCDFKRLQLLLGILNKHTKLNTYRRNVFVNVVAGLQMREPSTDLPIAIAIASSVTDIPVPHDAVFVGELGLAGELRMVRQVEKRVVEAAKMGFKRAFVPACAAAAINTDRLQGLSLVPCNTIREVVDKAFSQQGL